MHPLSQGCNFKVKEKTMKREATLSEIMNRLKTNEGYTEDFNLLDDYLELKSKSEKFSTEEFVVDQVFRFEGASNPSDNAVLYSITTTSGRKGILIDAYGTYSGQISDQMLAKLDLKANRPIN